MNSTYLVMIVLVVAIALAIVALAYYSIHERKRREAIQQLGLEMGMRYLEKDEGAMLSTLSRFHIFSLGRSKRITNQLDGTFRQAKTAIFDYRYTTGSGKHRQTRLQTIVYFQLERTLPTFTLSPQKFWHAIGAWLGYQDINFENFPVFSENFLLRGEDESAVRSLFNPSVLRFYEQNEGLSTEGSENALLIYRQGKRIDPGELRAFLELSYNVLVLYYQP